MICGICIENFTMICGICIENFTMICGIYIYRILPSFVVYV